MQRVSAVSPGVSSACGIDFAALSDTLTQQPYAVLPGLLSAADCAALVADFDDDARYRSTVDMARYNFGRGVYRYFSYPLPDRIASLRTALYPGLAAIANHWQALLGRSDTYPLSHAEYLERCHAVGQVRPTPLLLRYTADDYNCLHQDLYGEEVFPLQLAVVLSQQGRDFTGGEFVLTEQRPRMQSCAEVVPLGQGDGVVFAVSRRPVKGSRGYYQVNTRHGVSRVRSGQRLTLGIIFHDAR